MSKSPKSIGAKINRLTREIEEIDSYFYRANEKDDSESHAGMLERKRDDMVRGIVLQIHTAIEDVLDQHITLAITGKSNRQPRNQSARALRGILIGGESIGFHKKLYLALALGVITKRTKDRLHILNNLRNKCSHNWLLKVPVRHGRRPAQKKLPLLIYDGRDLHSVEVLMDFIAEFGGRIYFNLFVKYINLT